MHVLFLEMRHFQNMESVQTSVIMSSAIKLIKSEKRKLNEKQLRILKLLLTLVTLDNKRFSESQTANSQPQKVDFQ